MKTSKSTSTLSIGFETQILGLGKGFPDQIVTNTDLEKIVETNDRWIVERTGIQERRIALKSESNSDFAAKACEEAILNSKIDPSEIDLLIFATVTPDHLTPNTGAIIAKKLGVPSIPTLDISAACSGWIYGYVFADQLIRAGVYKHILVVAAETLSRIVNWEDRNTCILFGDGGGAAVIGRTPEGEKSKSYSSHLYAEGGLKDLLTADAGGSAVPFSLDVIANRSYCISMKGKEIFKVAVRTLASGASALLEENGLTLDDLDWFIPHQANLRIIEAVAKRLGLSMSKVIVNVDRFGNTSGATVPTAFAEAVENGKIKRGDLVLLDVFGAGLTYGATLLRF